MIEWLVRRVELYIIVFCYYSYIFFQIGGEVAKLGKQLGNTLEELCDFGVVEDTQWCQWSSPGPSASSRLSSQHLYLLYSV